MQFPEDHTVVLFKLQEFVIIVSALFLETLDIFFFYSLS